MMKAAYVLLVPSDGRLERAAHWGYPVNDDPFEPLGVLCAGRIDAVLNLRDMPSFQNDITKNYDTLTEATVSI